VDLLVAGGLREVGGIPTQRIEARRLQRLIQILWRDAGCGEDFPGLIVLAGGNGQEQVFGLDLLGICRSRRFLGSIENARQCRIDVELPGAAAGNARPPGERRFDRFTPLPRLATGAVHEPGGEPLLVVEQYFQEMLWGELLMALADRERLRRLDEAQTAIAIFVLIHVLSLGLFRTP